MWSALLRTNGKSGLIIRKEMQFQETMSSPFTISNPAIPERPFVGESQLLQMDDHKASKG
jgi:hypothetical protein